MILTHITHSHWRGNELQNNWVLRKCTFVNVHSKTSVLKENARRYINPRIRQIKSFKGQIFIYYLKPLYRSYHPIPSDMIYST
ncbi:unnamed protein product [Allacma fusca]|uniref:Uncharacterized protein n=1 Tax=Allacma fusca TaxID=39272 RepID=A0A8J2PJ64_9HEXA|nr:unnamed protein product [Allacma fusca]